MSAPVQGMLRFTCVNCRGVGSLLWLRGGGSIDHWMYGPKGSGDKAIEMIANAYDSYEVECGSSGDPEWEQHCNVLFPDQDAQRRMGNMDVIRQMESQGDRLEEPRPVEILNLFPDEMSAKKFAAATEHGGVHDGWQAEFRGPQGGGGGRAGECGGRCQARDCSSTPWYTFSSSSIIRSASNLRRHSSRPRAARAARGMGLSAAQRTASRRAVVSPVATRRPVFMSLQTSGVPSVS